MLVFNRAVERGFGRERLSRLVISTDRARQSLTLDNGIEIVGYSSFSAIPSGHFLHRRRRLHRRSGSRRDRIQRLFFRRRGAYSRAVCDPHPHASASDASPDRYSRTADQHIDTDARPSDTDTQARTNRNRHSSSTNGHPRHADSRRPIPPNSDTRPANRYTDIHSDSADTHSGTTYAPTATPIPAAYRVDSLDWGVQGPEGDKIVVRFTLDVVNDGEVRRDSDTPVFGIVNEGDQTEVATIPPVEWRRKHDIAVRHQIRYRPSAVEVAGRGRRIFGRTGSARI